MQSVVDISKQEKDITKKGSTERKLINKIKRVCEEDDCYLYKYFPFKISSHRRDKYEDLVVTSDHVKFNRQLLHVEKKVWKQLDAIDRDSIVTYNKKVNNNESIYGFDVPDKFWDVFKDKYSTIRSSTNRENNSRPRQKIIFNLHQYDNEE